MLNIQSWDDALLDKARVVKQLDPDVISPWVVCRFGGPNNVYVTVGNQSSSAFGQYVTQKNTAIITSFQYGFSTSGQNGVDGVQVEITAEQGGEFDYFIREVFPTTPADGNDKVNLNMEFQFGWTYNQCIYSDQTGGLITNPGLKLVSQPRYAVPRECSVQLDEGKMKYTIRGPSPAATLVQNKGMRMVYGKDNPYNIPDGTIKGHITKLFADQGMIVLFLKRTNESGICARTRMRLKGKDPCGGNISPSLHQVPNGEKESGPRSLTDDEIKLFEAPFQGDENLGGLKEWDFAGDSKMTRECGIKQNLRGQGHDPIEIAMQNLSNLRTEDNLGFVVGTDNRIARQPIVVFWESPLPTCEGVQKNRFYLGTYIVGGGNHSPVIRFTPQIKFTTAHTMGGGNSSGMSGANSLVENPCKVAGEGARANLPVSDSMLNFYNVRAGQEQSLGHQANARAQFSGYQAITAELEVQGEPRAYDPMYLCGHRICLIVCNPYFIQHVPNQCGNWLIHKDRIANEMLTNENWYIMGVDHQIKDGQFRTTYKLMLYTPSVTLGKDAPLGGEGQMGAITSPKIKNT